MLLVLFTCVMGFCLCQETLMATEISDDIEEGGPLHFDGRIVGGSIARIKQFPYQISLRYNEKHMCGGSIIDKLHIVTAAHCVEKGAVRKFSIRAGSSNRLMGGETRDVCSITKNPFFNNQTIDSDIAILKLCSCLPFGDSIKTVTLPKSNIVLNAGTIAVVSGWGYMAESSGILTKYLRQVQVPIVDQNECKKLYQSDGSITNNMVCAGFKSSGGKDSCQGDSGGPLVLDGVLVGIVSWGNGCARPDFPGVYTRVSQFLNFIATNTNR